MRHAYGFLYDIAVHLLLLTMHPKQLTSANRGKDNSGRGAERLTFSIFEL